MSVEQRALVAEDAGLATSYVADRNQCQNTVRLGSLNALCLLRCLWQAAGQTGRARRSAPAQCTA